MDIRQRVCCAVTTSLFAAWLVLYAPASLAGITYIDATDDVGGNTTLLDDSVWTATDAGSIQPADDAWSQRAFANNDTIFEAGVTSDFSSGGLENAPTLKTTASGLIPGSSYRVYAYFWSGSDWRLDATLDPADLDDNGTPGDPLDDFIPTSAGATYSKLPGIPGVWQAPLADPLDFDNVVIVEDSNLLMYQASIGIGVADASGNIAVYIDEWDNTDNFRAWYDGVGVQWVPEPSSYLLLGLAASGLLLWRRR